MRKPNPLKLGSKVAVIAPSGAENRERVNEAESAIRTLGLEPIMYPSCYERYGYLAGTDECRANDIHRAFCNDDIEGIIAMRGGYGAIRLLPRLDYDLIHENCKVFVGFSDVTALHIAFNQRAKIVTFHGPVGTSLITDTNFTKESLRANIFAASGESSLGTVLINNPIGHQIQCMVPGIAEGPIAGGNLSLLVATLGSAFEIDTKGKILFIEEVGEEPYRVDRMLHTLALAGKFKDCIGIILCTFEKCQSKGREPHETLTLNQIFKDAIKPFGKPMIGNFQVGHIQNQITIPMGIKVRLDATRGEMIFLEAGVDG